MPVMLDENGDPIAGTSSIGPGASMNAPKPGEAQGTPSTFDDFLTSLKGQIPFQKQGEAAQGAASAVLTGKTSPEDALDAYRNYLAMERTQESQAEARSPYATGAAHFAGAVGPLALSAGASGASSLMADAAPIAGGAEAINAARLPGALTLPEAASPTLKGALAGAVKPAAQNAALGAAQGASDSPHGLPDNDFGGLARDTLAGGAIGGTVGGLTHLGMSGLASFGETPQLKALRLEQARQGAAGNVSSAIDRIQAEAPMHRAYASDLSGMMHDAANEIDWDPSNAATRNGVADSLRHEADYAIPEKTRRTGTEPFGDFQSEETPGQPMGPEVQMESSRPRLAQVNNRSTARPMDEWLHRDSDQIAGADAALPESTDSHPLHNDQGAIELPEEMPGSTKGPQDTIRMEEWPGGRVRKQPTEQPPGSNDVRGDNFSVRGPAPLVEDWREHWSDDPNARTQETRAVMPHDPYENLFTREIPGSGEGEPPLETTEIPGTGRTGWEPATDNGHVPEWEVPEDVHSPVYNEPGLTLQQQQGVKSDYANAASWPDKFHAPPPEANVKAGVAADWQNRTMENAVGGEFPLADRSLRMTMADKGPLADWLTAKQGYAAADQASQAAASKATAKADSKLYPSRWGLIHKAADLSRSGATFLSKAAPVAPSLTSAAGRSALSAWLRGPSTPAQGSAAAQPRGEVQSHRPPEDNSHEGIFPRRDIANSAEFNGRPFGHNGLDDLFRAKEEYDSTHPSVDSPIEKAFKYRR